MNEFSLLIHEYGLQGIALGACTFIIIGLFHPIVIKAEYYFGTCCWWCFLVLGIVTGWASIVVDDTLWSSVLGVVAFSSLWSIKEVFEQRERVRKGWFPANPKRRGKGSEKSIKNQLSDSQ